MPTREDLRTLARHQAQKTLSASPNFHAMPQEEKLSVYKSLVDANYGALARQSSFSGAMEDKPKKASEMIDDKRHENRRIEQAGDLAGDFIENVDFPKFVRDLLKGVFDANLEVTLKQMEAYTKLMKAATASLATFINKIDDAASFAYLAENQSDDFSIDFSDEEQDENGQPKALLTDKDGNALDPSDNAIKAKIMDAKIAMAKEQRALLRETILMGITRLVVEKGVVKAGVIFDFKASEKIDKADKAALKKAASSSSSVSHSTGVLASIFGGSVGAGHTHSSQESQISVSSAKSKSTTDLAAKVTGSVEINFKSDYFKLDNFAQMYGAIQAGSGPGAAPAPGVPAAPPALPPAPRT